VHAALFALKNGRSSWDRDTVVIVDEAAMLDTRVTGELLGAARQAGAKVVLAGDDRQLASIERGGLFAELRQRHGAAEITEVTRQKVDWQRQATRDLAEGRFGEAVAAFDTAGAITWTQDQEDARKALVVAWTRDTAQQPDATRFVFAYTNRDVNALNADLRQVRRARGELGGPDVVLATKHGEAEFAIGDRVQFTDTDKKRHIYNGNVGTITGLDARTGEITARLDAPGGAGRVVTWSADAFEGFRHGYAGTIYKGQGKTLDHTYLYHTEHWRSAASYVALTRQRESAQVFVARETARDAGQLARQMARGEVKAASIAWVTAEEVAVRQAAPPEVARSAPVHEHTSPTAEQDDPLRAKVREALQRRREAAEVAPVEESPREALRRELLSLDRGALAAAARADRVGDPQLYTDRAMTVQDAARLVDPAYAAAADRTAQLRKETSEVEASIQHYEGMQRTDQAEGDQRWKAMGFMRQVMHKTGVRRDTPLAGNEGVEKRVLTNLAELDLRRAKLAQQMPEAEKAEAKAFAKAEPGAAVELAKRQDRAGLAREVLTERRQQDIAAREQQKVRSRERGRDRGFER
jgi:hypothetical protein